MSLAAGLGLVRDGRYFEAHEVFEELWRAADADERDFYQGLVHVAVAPYQESRGHEVAVRSQLAKAGRRLSPFTPTHHGVDVAALLAWVDRSLTLGRCDGPPPVSSS